MPRVSTVVIMAIWALAIGSAISGASSPMQGFPREMTNATATTILLMPVLFFGVMSFWMPHSPFYHPKLARFVDSRFGDNVFASFLVRLKPLLLFAVAAALQGAIGLWHSVRAGESSGAYAIHGFFISGGVGFAIAHLVLYYRRAPGVHPLVSPLAPEQAPPQRMSLKGALRAYWWTIIGLAAFPTILFVGGEYFRVPFEYFALPFFAVGLLAGWPYFSGRAPFSYCIVLGGIWLLGGVVAAVIAQAMQALVGGP